MSETHPQTNLSMHENRLASADELYEKLRTDPRLIRICCGRAIEPQLAETRQSSGTTLFISVWRCPSCGRATS